MILVIGKFDHHQKNRNGKRKRKNGINYSSIGLLWKKFGKDYLEKLNVKDIYKTFEYMDTELIQYIDATDNMQMEYLVNKISPDFVKLCNPEWNEEIDEDAAFIKAVKLGDEFWIFDKDMPYRKALKLIKNLNVKYFIFKSRREGYDIRAIYDNYKFSEKITKCEDINDVKRKTNIFDLIYLDTSGK